MKKLALAILMLFSLPVFADQFAISDPGGQRVPKTAGEFSDTYTFVPTANVEATFTVVGARTCVAAGRGHPCQVSYLIVNKPIISGNDGSSTDCLYSVAYSGTYPHDIWTCEGSFRQGLTYTVAVGGAAGGGVLLSYGITLR